MMNHTQPSPAEKWFPLAAAILCAGCLFCCPLLAPNLESMAVSSGWCATWPARLGDGDSGRAFHEDEAVSRRLADLGYL